MTSYKERVPCGGHGANLMTTREFFLGLLVGVLCPAGAWGQTYVISTVVGTGATGYSGDSGAATAAMLARPGAIAFDSSGNMYIADSGNNVVRKVSNGIITTIAGNTTAGYTGDKGPATSAELDDPTGVAVDSQGNVYIADAGNQVVRMVTPSGTITTFAGSISLGAGFAGDGGPATEAQLNVPTAVAVDSQGNVYIADSNNNAIREVSGGNINTVNPSTEYLITPEGVAVDAAGNVYVADTGNERVVMFSAANSYAFNLIAGNGVPGFSGDNGPAQNAELQDPAGVAVDAAGYVYIADTINSRIRKVAPDGTITTIAGTGIPVYGGDGQYATTASLYFPHGVAFDPSGNVYIADTYSSVVRNLALETPVFTASAVVNSADFVPQISPGALASIVGVNFATGKASAQAPLPDSLGGVQVFVNGVAAPILYVQQTLINFQVPWETQPGTAAISVTVNGVASNTVTVPVGTAAPGIFLLSAGVGAVVNQDGSVNGPAHPAKSGDTLTVYLSGSGPVSITPDDGAASPSNPPSVLTSSYSAAIGPAPAPIVFAGLGPTQVGVTVVNLTVPSGLASTTYPLAITINGETSNTVPIVINQ